MDLACGAGRTTLRLFEMGYRVKGIDLSPVLLSTAKKRFPYISFEEGTYCKINEKEESYDNVLISFNGLDYAFPEEERENAISECFRVLKKGGCFMFSTHNIKHIHGALLPWNKHKLFLLKNMFNAFLCKKYIFEPHAGLWTFYGSPEYIKKQVEKYGFRFKEMFGFRSCFNNVMNKYLSPYIHYIFLKE